MSVSRTLSSAGDDGDSKKSRVADVSPTRRHWASGVRAQTANDLVAM